jgi:acetyl-CoA synthetase
MNSNIFNFGYDIIDRRAAECPNGAAVRWLSPSGFVLEISNADLHHHSDVTACYLQRLGIGQGSVVMLYGIEKVFELTTILAALHKLCAVPAFDLHNKPIERSGELNAYSIIATNNSPVIQIVTAERQNLSSVELLISTGSPYPNYWLDLHTGARLAKTFKPLKKLPENAVSLIIYDEKPQFFNETYPLQTQTDFVWDRFYRAMVEGKIFEF